MMMVSEVVAWRNKMVMTDLRNWRGTMVMTVHMSWWWEMIKMMTGSDELVEREDKDDD
jgi:hypothetical protein